MAPGADRPAILLLLIFIVILFTPSAAYAREFPKIESELNDIPDVLTDIDEDRLRRELGELKRFNHQSGLIIITHRTDEWDFIEFGHDLYDHARSLGMLNETGFLIYLSVEDRKLTFILGKDMERVTDPDEVRAIRNKAGEYLESEEYFNALSHILSRLRMLNSGAELENARDKRSDFLILGGLIILVAVLLHNISRRRKSLREKNEPGQ